MISMRCFRHATEMASDQTSSCSAIHDKIAPSCNACPSRIVRMQHHFTATSTWTSIPTWEQRNASATLAPPKVPDTTTTRTRHPRLDAAVL